MEQAAPGYLVVDSELTAISVWSGAHLKDCRLADDSLVELLKDVYARVDDDLLQLRLVSDEEVGTDLQDVVGAGLVLVVDVAVTAESVVVVEFEGL